MEVPGPRSCRETLLHSDEYNAACPFLHRQLQSLCRAKLSTAYQGFTLPDSSSSYSDPLAEITLRVILSVLHQPLLGAVPVRPHPPRDPLLLATHLV